MWEKTGFLLKKSLFCVKRYYLCTLCCPIRVITKAIGLLLITLESTPWMDVGKVVKPIEQCVPVTGCHESGWVMWLVVSHHAARRSQGLNDSYELLRWFLTLKIDYNMKNLQSCVDWRVKHGYINFLRQGAYCSCRRAFLFVRWAFPTLSLMKWQKSVSRAHLLHINTLEIININPPAGLGMRSPEPDGG